MWHKNKKLNVTNLPNPLKLIQNSSYLRLILIEILPIPDNQIIEGTKDGKQKAREAFKKIRSRIMRLKFITLFIKEKAKKNSWQLAFIIC
jgi:hypothetical protein